jgi:beta-fructofuranosidase
MSEQRPLYHFQPPANWMNDPNGLIQWKGQYHLFYQYNPNGPYHGTIHWGHAASTDLVQWTHLPIALAPTPQSPDEDGCWSGCAVNDKGVPTFLYTGAQRDKGDKQTQCLATSTDDLLTWQKYPGNPVIAAPPEGLDVLGFRDPCVWQDGDTWYCVIGSGIKGVGGTALLYMSHDLIHWTYLHPLYTREQGATEPVWTGSMWECPQFFALGDKHVLLVSVWDNDAPIHTVYVVGPYADHTFTPDVVRRFDLGAAYYAPATMRDDQGRRIVWGWSWEARRSAAQRAAGWAGVMSLPRLLTLRPDGSLGVEPVPELHILRGTHRRFADIDVTPASSHLLRNVHGDCLELVATFEPGDATAFGLKVRCSPGDEECTVIVYDGVARRLAVDRDRASLDPAAYRGVHGGPLELAAGEHLTLHIFLDRSIVEVYANGQVCLTERIYPSRADSIGVALFAHGGSVRVTSVDVWKIAGG